MGFSPNRAAEDKDASKHWRLQPIADFVRQNAAGCRPWRVWAEINAEAIAFNVRSIRRHIGVAPRIIAVVKADAYGHGAPVVARAVLAGEADAWFGVATVDECAELRAAGIGAPILVLSPCLPEAVGQIVQVRATPVLSNAALVAPLAAACGTQDSTLSVHLEVDTGMGRAGVLSEDVAQVAQRVCEESRLRLEGLMTHFPNAENDPDATHAQAAELVRVVDKMQPVGSTLLRHAANSAGILACPESRLDMVRPGLLLYGLLPQLSRPASLPELRPALTLKSRIALLRQMRAGSSVSYGGTFRFQHDGTMAVVPIGYGDGYPRELSNRGSMLVRGLRCPILGRVCMDATMIDVTRVVGVSEGDEVVLVGRQGDQEIRADELAHAMQGTEHEITTRLSQRVPRLPVPVY